jgi:pyruvate/2-oxoglutarate/acetoin dehydrogenase E1 component
LAFLGSSSSPLAGVLAPGQQNGKQFYFNSTVLGQAQFRVEVISANNTTPIDWALVESSARPADITDEAWDALWPTARARLARSAGRRMTEAGLVVIDAQRLRSLEQNRADALDRLRTMVAAARTQGRVCVFLEPIALYMTKDLHSPGDGLWQDLYPTPGDAMPVDEIGVYEPTGGAPTLVIATYANGLWMSLRVQARLAAKGIFVRVLDLRWLLPLPLAAVLPHAREVGRMLVVDECRASSGIADTVVAHVAEHAHGVRLGRVQGLDSYIPLGDAANLVLVSEADIEAGVARLLGDA